MKVIATST